MKKGQKNVLFLILENQIRKDDFQTSCTFHYVDIGICTFVLCIVENIIHSYFQHVHCYYLSSTTTFCSLSIATPMLSLLNFKLACNLDSYSLGYFFCVKIFNV